jgi:signal transduction protein with GAF and PtsI domain
LEDQLSSVEDILQERRKINEELVNQLTEEIKRQKNRLDTAIKEDRPAIRDKLERLYRELREEKRGYWSDQESWREQKLELEEELAEIDEFEDLYDV